MAGMKLKTPRGIKPPKEGKISGGTKSAVLPSLARPAGVGKRPWRNDPPAATHMPGEPAKP